VATATTGRERDPDQLTDHCTRVDRPARVRSTLLCPSSSTDLAPRHGTTTATLPIENQQPTSQGWVVAPSVSYTQLKVYVVVDLVRQCCRSMLTRTRMFARDHVVSHVISKPQKEEQQNLIRTKKNSMNENTSIGTTPPLTPLRQQQHQAVIVLKEGKKAASKS
jgi:hypothetical protein